MRPGNAIRDRGRFGDDDRRSKVKAGMRWVPTVTATGAAAPLDLPVPLRPYTNTMTASGHLSEGWVSYPERSIP
jgi:hypothetical protein